MKLQQATRCAIWSILELASRQNEQIRAQELAETYGISQNHLAKVLRTLIHARIVSSARGPGGGFMFCGNARRLTLYDIIELFESDWVRDSDAETSAPNAVAGELQRVMKEVDRITVATLRSVTVHTLIANANRGAGHTSAPLALPKAS